MLYCRPSRWYCVGCGVEISRSEKGAVTSATMTMLITASGVSVGFCMSDRSCLSVAVISFCVVVIVVAVDVVVAPLIASRRAVGLPAPGVSY